MVRQAEIVVLSVKPQILPQVLDEVAPHLKPAALVISIAAGTPLAAIERRLPPGTRVVRTMPNTPALVGAGATAIAAGQHAKDDDLEATRRIFDAVGMTVVIDESQLDAVTGLSGLGAGLRLPDHRGALGRGRQDGAVALQRAGAGGADACSARPSCCSRPSEHPGRLKDMVTSPGGTAIAGLHTLEAGGLRTTLINAVEAATNRSRELGALADKKMSRRDAAFHHRGGRRHHLRRAGGAARLARAPGAGAGDRLKVQLTAPPVDGAANEALVALVAAALGTPRGEVAIVRGQTGRKKTVRVSGATRAALLSQLEDIMNRSLLDRACSRVAVAACGGKSGTLTLTIVVSPRDDPFVDASSVRFTVGDRTHVTTVPVSGGHFTYKISSSR